MHWMRASVIVILLLSIAGCAKAEQRATSRPFTVAAAADLQFAFREIGVLFEQRTGQKVIFTFGSTGNLAKQIENGAPIDLFAAANVAFIDNLREQAMVITETQQLYAIGRIVMAGNKAARVELSSLADLLTPRIKKVAIANPEHAPYGLAAKQALMSAGIWTELQPKLVYGENIRQTLQFIQTGNAEAGIVALSVANVPDITYTLIDDSLYTPLKQALAVIKGTPNEEIAREFSAFVNGPAGQSVMQRYGFVLPGDLER